MKFGVSEGMVLAAGDGGGIYLLVWMKAQNGHDRILTTILAVIVPLLVKANIIGKCIASGWKGQAVPGYILHSKSADLPTFRSRSAMPPITEAQYATSTMPTFA